MHETFPSVAEVERQTEASDNSSPEYINPDWDDSGLTGLVSANQDVVVRVPWLGGVEMTVSDAIKTHPGPWNPENEPAIVGAIYELLANRVTAAEESEEEMQEEKLAEIEEELEPADKIAEIKEKNAAKEEPAREEADQQNTIGNESEKTETSKNIVDNEMQPNEVGEKREQQKPQSINEAEKPAEPTANRVAAAVEEAAPATAKSEPQRPATASAQAETVKDSRADTSVEAASVGPSTPEVSAANDRAFEGSPQAFTADKIDQETISVQPTVEHSLNEVRQVAGEPETEPTQQTSVVEMPEVDPESTIIPAHDAFIAPKEPEPGAEQEAAPAALPAEVDSLVEVELLDIPSLEGKELVIADDTMELAKGIEVIKVEEALTAHNFPLETDSPTDSADEEVLVSFDHFKDMVPVLDERYIPYDTPELEVIEELPETNTPPILPAEGDRGILTDNETPVLERVVPISSSPEEMKGSLVQIAEFISDGEPQTAEKVNEKLDKIIEVAAKFEAGNDEEVITKEEVQEELEELFNELFEEMGIDYTPELIESFARLTLEQVAGEAEKLEDEELDEAPVGDGTHEAIKQLLLGLSTVKKEDMIQAFAIGRSALRLYSFN